MIIEIEGYQIKAFVSGKKCTAGKLQWQMKKVMERIVDDQHFVSLFCHLFDYEEIVYSDETEADYVIDTDILRVYKPVYG